MIHENVYHLSIQRYLREIKRLAYSVVKVSFLNLYVLNSSFCQTLYNQLFMQVCEYASRTEIA